MNLGAKKMEDGLIHFRYYEKRTFTPFEKLHFSGNIYLIQGGYSFSATTMFIGHLKGQKNVQTIGEETGGGYYGNSAMHIPTIILPHSQIQVSLPMYKLVIDKTREKGRGILPDLYISPSSQAIKKGIDPKMIKIKSLLQPTSVN